MPRQNSPEDSVAIELFDTQLNELRNVRNLNADRPEFTFWRNRVTELFQRYLPPNNPHFITFRTLSFCSLTTAMSDYPFGGSARFSIQTGDVIASQDNAKFLADCGTAEACIGGAISTIRDFGIDQGQPEKKGPQRAGSVQQNFHGPVTIQSQAIATDYAVQNIVEMGSMGPGLKEISGLLRESMDLTGREIQDGLKAIQEIANEVKHSPDKRDWKSLFEYGGKLLGIADKAIDVSHKLAPYLPQIVALLNEAKRHL
jgi:hypothetical protein